MVIIENAELSSYGYRNGILRAQNFLALNSRLLQNATDSLNEVGKLICHRHMPSTIRALAEYIYYTLGKLATTALKKST